MGVRGVCGCVCMYLYAVYIWVISFFAFTVVVVVVFWVVVLCVFSACLCCCLFARQRTLALPRPLAPAALPLRADFNLACFLAVSLPLSSPLLYLSLCLSPWLSL